MNIDYQIPEPILFNPIKHHLGYIKEFINLKIDHPNMDIQALTRDIRHIGRSVMDIYTGSLSIRSICREIGEFLALKDLLQIDAFCRWAGADAELYRIISLSDGSGWTLKFHNNPQRFVHIFPARNSKDGSSVFPSFRVKSNTLKSALFYIIIIGKDLITGEDLNKVRPLLGLSPVKNAIETEAILEMIEILRG
jgi:hypothetical protein